MAQAQIFKATYSGVPVYEMQCNGIAVMRRRSDSYLNATQILKVAEFDKPQRTRILEREVQTGEHEKVQGGYGKYQGTWVPFERGVALAEQYHVDHLLKPMFDFVKGDTSPPIAPKHVTAASTRPRKVREPREARETRRKKPKRYDDEFSENSSQYSEVADNDIPMVTTTRNSASPSTLYRSMTAGDTMMVDDMGTPHTSHGRRKKRSRLYMDEVEVDDAMGDELENREPYAQKLLQHFVADDPDVPSLLLHPPRDLDVNVIIDDEGHTSLHWAAAMGRLKVVKLLIHHGADIYRVNYKGQTALMRSVLFTNNFDIKSFHQLLEMLQRTIFNIDKKDQTVFHHVAATASWKGKVHASRYYMECLIEKLAYNRSELISILNVQDVYGDTALTIAARIGNKKLVRLLMDAGASTEIANEEGMTSQDYLAESERTRPFRDAVSPKTASSNEHATRARLRQRVESMFKQMLANDRSTPAVSQLFDSFAGSYERDLTQKETLVKEKKTELDLNRKRLASTHHMLDHIQFDPSSLTKSNAEADHLELRLRKLTHEHQRLKLSHMIDSEEKNAKMSGGDGPKPENDAAKKQQLIDDVVKLGQTLKTLQENRQQLVKDIMKMKAQTPGKRYQEYKRLISMCCNVAYENVDVMLSPLLASFDESAA
ncbi:uncharacterized protein BYT42DRAFT_553753 [Radiomyces spectabilis]|uniref:uncharacterized protein n=1 Tax=Radiomyces spectabilis TaxID=64574 RepID=UPI0022202996|nr:uncharacterized protein BYT42DRAFT_553753 [Radiomyces spectabilis]KAI8394229.1 hypothetical protein BYT42DRAFT_553753 [Radiomyces spectabilis]